MEKQLLIKNVTAAQRGDVGAINTLFNEYYNDVHYFAYKTVKDAHLADDITQETFIEVIRTIKNLEAPAAFVSWLNKIAYHQCSRYFRKKRDVLAPEDENGNSPLDSIEEENSEFIPDEALEKEELRRTIMTMLDTLTEEQRSAVILRYYDELSVKEIAKIQGVSEGTVKSRLNYARKSIRSSVEKYELDTGTRLYSIPFFPLSQWALDTMNYPDTYSVKAVTSGVSKATGVLLDYDENKAQARKDEFEGKSISDPQSESFLSGVPRIFKILAIILSALIVTAAAAVGIASANSKYKETYYSELIEDFVPDHFNEIYLDVGEKDSPQAAIWLQSGFGDAYSSDESVLTVSDRGTVTAVGEGEAYVIITSSSFFGFGLNEVYHYTVGSYNENSGSEGAGDFYGVDFEGEIENFNSSLHTYNLTVGEDHTPPSAIWSTINCKSSDTSVVTVDDRGKVTAHSAGEAYVIIKVKDSNTMYTIYKYIVTEE